MELVFEIIQAVTNIFLIFGVVIALIQLNLSRKIAAADLERRKKESTIEFTCEILSELDKLSPILKEHTPVSYDAYMDEKNKELHDNVLRYLKLMERICTGINTDIYDFDVFQRICGRRVWKRWFDFKPLIYKIRDYRSFDKLYIEYENVANRLEDIYKPVLPSNGNIENKV